jgi:hypothetical protein
MTLGHLDNLDLFSQFVTNPETFFQFLINQWDSIFTWMFVCQFQPANPTRPWWPIQGVSTLHGKGTAQTIEKLLRPKNILIQQFVFHVTWLPFDNDSSFNILHSECEVGEHENLSWKPEYQHSRMLRRDLRSSSSAEENQIAMHILCQCSWVWSRRHAVLHPRYWKTEILSSVVFINSHMTKMHHSLPLRLFSQPCFQRPSITGWTWICNVATVPVDSDIHGESSINHDQSGFRTDQILVPIQI